MKNIKSFNNFNESEKWIQDAIKKPGSLRKSLKKKKGEKITASEIGDEIAELKKKDKDSEKEGIQGLSKKDLAKLRKLNLAKTLKGFNESSEEETYDEIDPLTIQEFSLLRECMYAVKSSDSPSAFQAKNFFQNQENFDLVVEKLIKFLTYGSKKKI